MNQIAPNPLGGWQLSISPCGYLAYCVLGSLVIRVIHHLIKAIATSKGDVSENTPTFGYWKSFRYGFCGFSEFKGHSDLWLSAIIGFAELSSYPVLMFLGSYTFIGGWLILKTAGQWSGWKNSRTAFNRFLVTNIFTIAVSFFWLSHYIIRK